MVPAATTPRATPRRNIGSCRGTAVPEGGLTTLAEGRRILAARRRRRHRRRSADHRTNASSAREVAAASRPATQRARSARTRRRACGGRRQRQHRTSRTVFARSAAKTGTMQSSHSRRRLPLGSRFQGQTLRNARPDTCCSGSTRARATAPRAASRRASRRRRHSGLVAARRATTVLAFAARVAASMTAACDSFVAVNSDYDASGVSGSRFGKCETGF